jgi:hypothetical protein
MASRKVQFKMSELSAAVVVAAFKKNSKIFTIIFVNLILNKKFYIFS